MRIALFGLAAIMMVTATAAQAESVYVHNKTKYVTYFEVWNNADQMMAKACLPPSSRSDDVSFAGANKILFLGRTRIKFAYKVNPSSCDGPNFHEALSGYYPTSGTKDINVDVPEPPASALETLAAIRRGKTPPRTIVLVPEK